MVQQANRDGIMLVGNSAEPRGLDLQLVSGVPESKILSSLFEGLVADHPSEDNTPSPGVATHWEHNDDLTVAEIFRTLAARHPDGGLRIVLYENSHDAHDSAHMRFRKPAEYQQFAATCLDLLLQAAQDATLQHFMAQSRATRWQFLYFVVQ